MKKWTLQWRITLLTSLVLAVCSAALTLGSLYNSRLYLGVAAEPEIALPVLEEGTAAQAGSVAPAVAAQRAFDLRSVGACILVTVLGGFAVYYMTGHALKPLRQLSGKTAQIDAQTLSEKLPIPEARDEVGQLVANFNGMLARLEDAFARQRSFTRNAAHELKTPLATLKTGAQVLATDPEAKTEDYQDYIGQTLGSIDRMTALVNDLLLLAAAERKQSREEVLLEPLLEAVQSELEDRLDGKGIVCQVNCDVPSLQGNPAMLYRVFFNLMENACKYCGGGSHIWVHATEKQGGITVRFRDDGPGIPEKHLPYLFDSFYRVEDSRSRATGGSGLGLSIVKTIVETEGGTVEVHSDGKSGTEFILFFPQ